MQIKSNLITAVATALTVTVLTWNPAADATGSQSSSISVCVNKKTGAMRNDSKCLKTEREISIAQSEVKMTVPEPVQADEVPTRIQLANVPVSRQLPIGRLAGQSVQTVVSHITVPNLYGRDQVETLVGPTCPDTAPVKVAGGSYSTNYSMTAAFEFLNSDDSYAGYVSPSGSKATFGEPDGGYPKDGDMDLYLLTICAPILVVQ